MYGVHSYIKMDPEEAASDFRSRLAHYEKQYQPIDEDDLRYICTCRFTLAFRLLVLLSSVAGLVCCALLIHGLSRPHLPPLCLLFLLVGWLLVVVVVVVFQ
jgi:uncharacterized membrane protein